MRQLCCNPYTNENITELSFFVYLGKNEFLSFKKTEFPWITLLSTSKQKVLLTFVTSIKFILAAAIACKLFRAILTIICVVMIRNDKYWQKTSLLTHFCVQWIYRDINPATWNHMFRIQTPHITLHQPTIYSKIYHHYHSVIYIIIRFS